MVLDLSTSFFLLKYQPITKKSENKFAGYYKKCYICTIIINQSKIKEL